MNKDQKRKYNSLVLEARRIKDVDDPQALIALYKEMLVLMPDSNKIVKRIAKLRAKLESEERWDLGDGFLIPMSVHNRLYPHQREGVKWLIERFKSNDGGCVLGDDMGLGKTSQICAMLLGLLSSCKITTAIIVAPLSVTEHWCSEMENYSQWNSGTGRLNMVMLHGNQSKENRVETIKWLQDKGGVVITTYGMVLNNFELLKDNVWDAVCLDEGHKIRNPSIQVAKIMKKIRSVFRVVITGTPIQNNLTELWSLFDFVHPRLLGTRQAFNTEFELPIGRGSEKGATSADRGVGTERAGALRRIIEPHFLRREKDTLVTKLTSSKHELIVWVRLTQDQIDMYKQFADETVDALKKKIYPLAQLQHLRKICQHPLLFPDQTEYSASSKLSIVRDLVLSFKNEEHRVLIFSQSVKMLDIIESVLKEDSVEWLRLDGVNTKMPSERKNVMDLFNDNPIYTVMLLTTQCGGLGVNLVGADRVIVYDPSWNPSSDAQAVDRAYRLGQTRDVIVYRLITCGSIEEKIYRKQVFKDALMRTAVQRSNPLRYFSREEMRDLFKLGDVTRSETCEHLNDLHVDQTILHEHIAWLIDVCHAVGISHHTLLFSKADERDRVLTPVQERRAAVDSVRRLNAKSRLPVFNIDCCAEHSETIKNSVGGHCHKCRCYLSEDEIAQYNDCITANDVFGALLICSDDPDLVKRGLCLL